MAQPAHRNTSSSKRRRASHFALKKQQLTACGSCKTPILPHRACPSCGNYAGRKVVTMKDPLAKKHKHETPKK